MDASDDKDGPRSQDEQPTRAERPVPHPTPSGRPPATGGEGPPLPSNTAGSRPGAVTGVARHLEAQDFGERYEVRGLIGKGGVGEVHRCHDRQIGRDVALKRLHGVEGGSTTASDLEARFVREARVQGQLEHPAVVPVYDLGVTPEGEAYFTMKRIGGRTLQEILNALRQGDMEVRREYPRNKLLGIFRQVCLAVDYAHARGVIHRDVKPSNVMVGHFGEVYVLDWGLAKVVSTDQAAVVSDPEEARTVQGQVLGTPGYMAPEQLAGAVDVDRPADVYALGAILFELLTLQRLHQGGSASSLIRSTQMGAEARPSRRAPEMDTPPELEESCVRATALEPADRRISARDLAEAVERFLEGDRDLELRRKLAAGHSKEAEAQASLALGAGGGMEHRTRALREAGRALALDPESEKASAVLMRLMLKPPASAPEQAVERVSREVEEETREAARSGAFGYLVFLGLLGFVVLIGVESWTALALIAAPLVVAAGTCFALLRSEHYAPWMGMAIAVLSFGAIAATSGLFGSLVVVPGLAAANVMSLNVGAVRRQRRIVIALGCASVVLPFLLQWAGVLPPSYVIEGGRIAILPVAQAFPPVATRLELLAAALGTILIPALTVGHVGDSLERARTRLHTQAWQLRQLVPGAPDDPR